MELIINYVINSYKNN